MEGDLANLPKLEALQTMHLYPVSIWPELLLARGGDRYLFWSGEQRSFIKLGSFLYATIREDGGSKISKRGFADRVERSRQDI